VTNPQQDLFGLAPDVPDGFRYAAALLAPDEQAQLAAHIAGLPFRPFDFHGYQGNRRIVSFGLRYDYGREAVAPAEPLPGFLLPLRDKAAAFAGLKPQLFGHALVTEYAPGAGIGWHRDKAVFGEVVGVSLLAPCSMRFRRRRGAGWERKAAPLAPGSAYLLAGPARSEWEHSITPMEVLRYSVTFRRYVGGDVQPAGDPGSGG
jgi:alkylated DNA repair dioxygenase AlkB